MATKANAIPLQTRENAAPGTQSNTIHSSPGAVVPSRTTVSTVNTASSNSPTTQTPSAGAKMSCCCMITKAISSSRINALIAVIALGAGVYYFYEQYTISYKTWELGIWKDCRDRADLVNSSICQRYTNVTYDNIASRSITDNVTQVEISMVTAVVNEIVNGSIVGKSWALSNALLHTSYLVSGRERKPWAMALIALFMSILCIQTSSNNMAGLWLCLPYLLECAMEAFKPWLRWSIAVQDSPRIFQGDRALDSILRYLQELVRISVLLLSAASLVLRVWLGPKFSESSLSQLYYSVLFVFLPFCLASVAVMCVQRLGRSAEFSYDQEAQDTIEILGGLQWLKGPRMDPGVQNVARSRQVYIRLVAEALLIAMLIPIYLL